MKRDLKQLADNAFDVVVVGGGIYGAAAAREAALQGLRTALIDKGDFCGATSANSLKIIHGGLRYLQQADIVRMRESVIERRTMLRIAPHLVHPLPCMMPTHGLALKSKPVMSIGMLMNDVISFDRNVSADPQKFIPPGKTIPRGECLRLLPGLAERDVTGAATWHDAYAHNSERLVVEMVLSAAEHGAVVANYVALTGFLRNEGRVSGIVARDVLTGETLDIRAGVVVNNTGPWVNETLSALGDGAPRVDTHLALGMNFVTTKQVIQDNAVGLESHVDGKPSRLLFFMPWRGKTLAGTYYRMHEGSPDALAVTEDDIAEFLAALNAAYPTAELKREDVALIHAGVLPCRPPAKPGQEPRLARHYRLIDHAAQGVEGLVSVLGVKYTTARDVAQRTVAMVCRKLDRSVKGAGSRSTPLPGGDIKRFDTTLSEALSDAPKCLGAEGVRRFVMNYGSRYHNVLGTGAEDQDLLLPVATDAAMLRCEVVYAVREEMAQHLTDVVFRRTDCGSAGLPSDDVLNTCAAVMAAECGWDDARTADELARVRRACSAWDGLQVKAAGN